LGKTLVVYGSSTSTGLIVTQIATAAGIYVIAITGAKDFELSKRCGAGSVIDHKDLDVVGKVVEAVRNSRHEFVGIFDAISSPDNYVNEPEHLGATRRRALGLHASAAC
jgi:NADPH:quinone reductase-like Zn-dependent oxidoreductase